MKKKLILIFLVLVIFVGLFFNFSKNQVQEETLLSFLNKQYSNKSLVKTFDPIGNFLISAASSNTSCCGENSIDPFDEKATPSIVVSDANNLKIKSIYEVSFTNSGKENKGNLIHIVEAKQIKDVFVAEWSIYYGGSSGLKGMAIFGSKDGQFQPIAGYPFESDSKSSLILMDKFSNKKYSFPITGDSMLSEVTDLNKDGKLDLLYADWTWDLQAGESHYQDRPWNLQVYELIDNKFKVAKWWNNGEVYKTDEKFGYDDEAKSKLIQLFYSKNK